MRLLKMTVTALLLSVGGAVAAAPPAVAAADTAAPVLADVTVSPDAVSVAGLALVPVTVAVHLTDESGVEEIGDMSGGTLPYVALKRVAGGKTSVEYAELALASGTAQDGMWSATIQVPSTWDGRWEISRVVAADARGNRIDVDPSGSAAAATLDVTGTHLPAVTMRFEPDPLLGDGPLTMEGRFFYADTGEGIANQPIYFGYDNFCAEGRSPSPNGTTAADGTFAKRYPTGDGFLRCVGILRPSNVAVTFAVIVGAAGHPRVKPVVTATANRTAVGVGAKVTFTGTVVPDGYSVQLQQLRNGVWRTVDSALVRDRGRFTLDVTPGAPGTYRYRVVVPNDDPELVGVSQAVVVQVTPASTPAPEGLPVTGPAALSLLGGAVALVLGGAALVLVGRRRRTPAASDES